HAQSLIRGVVRDAETEESLPGVTVTLGNSSVQTNNQGQFEIAGSIGASISFSFVGYQDLQLNSEANMQVSLHKIMSSLDEVVVVGYGTQKRTHMTAAVDVVRSEERRGGK